MLRPGDASMRKEIERFLCSIKCRHHIGRPCDNCDYITIKINQYLLVVCRNLSETYAHGIA